jgi:hypothetical protein
MLRQQPPFPNAATMTQGLAQVGLPTATNCSEQHGNSTAVQFSFASADVRKMGILQAINRKVIQSLIHREKTLTGGGKSHSVTSGLEIYSKRQA